MDVLGYVIDKVDLALLMSVNPGFGGQKFIPGTLDKRREARALLGDLGSEARLEVDGAFKADNIGQIAADGADTFVAGSAIFGTPDYARTIGDMGAAIASAAR